MKREPKMYTLHEVVFWSLIIWSVMLVIVAALIKREGM